MSKKKDIGSFGDPSYLVKKFDDISKAVYYTRSAAAKAITELVKSKSTKKDNLYVYSVLKVSGEADGKKVTDILAHVAMGLNGPGKGKDYAMGLNGPGKGKDYAAALKRLLDTGKFAVIDAWIDAIDDLWDFILVYREGK